MRHARTGISLALFTCLTLMCSVGYAQPYAKHYLALDQQQHFMLDNVSVMSHKASYVGRAFSLTEAWEVDYKLIYPGTTVRDPSTGQYRMYYEVANTTGSLRNRHVAMATSQDGRSWTKPAVNATGSFYSTNPANNFISIDGTDWAYGASVFVDSNPSSSEPYKMVYRSAFQNILHAASSVDGIHFQTTGTIDDLTSHPIGGLDSQNTAFWDPKTEKYRSYMRYWYPRDATDPANVIGQRRGVHLKESEDWGDWSDGRQLIIDPNDLYGDADNTQLYTPGVTSYKGQYIGLPSVFYDPARGNPTESGAIEPSVMHSNDGVNWSSLTSDPLLSLDVHNLFGSDYMAFTQPTIVETDSDLLIYYSIIDRNHEDDSAFTFPYDFETEMHIASLRKDGFASVEFADSLGTWTTDRFSILDETDLLSINAIIGGDLQVELIDADSLTAFAGFGIDDFDGVSAGDYLNGNLAWGDSQLQDLSGQDVRLRFSATNSSIFSFRAVSVPEPSGIAVLLISCAALCRRLERCKHVITSTA